MKAEEIDKLVKEEITKLISENCTPEKMDAFWEAYSKQREDYARKYRRWFRKQTFDHYKQGDPQKFKSGVEVRVCDMMPPMMSHFQCGFNAIVEYTYKERYGNGNHDSYSLVVLDENSNPVNSVAWYNQYQLTLVDNDRLRGLDIIDQYKQKKI